VPGREAFLEPAKRLLIRPFARFAGEDDVDEFVGGIVLVAEVRRTVKDGQNSGNLAKKTDSLIELFLKIFRRQRGDSWKSRTCQQQLPAPFRDLAWEHANSMQEIPALTAVRWPA